MFVDTSDVAKSVITLKGVKHEVLQTARDIEQLLNGMLKYKTAPLVKRVQGVTAYIEFLKQEEVGSHKLE